MTTPETDVLAVLPDGRTSRYAGRPPGDQSGDFNPDDIGAVDGKVATFERVYPNGIIDASDITQIAENAWLVTARVWKDRADQDELPDRTGSSVRFVNLDGHTSEAFPLESAQTIAIGRALRFLPGINNPDSNSEE
jgi:hypothetical protein